ncbi:MAG: Pyrrolo-quinoline quinone repeat-containing protein, partial [Verrucomicrobiales bacterium]|nr:Pyrrolo-quinoline quinone repeat-containing protein [Verrucomicrobiales bacterium]
MNFSASRFLPLTALALVLAPLAAHADEWFSWRGPSQDGRSAEKYEQNVFGDAPDWTYDISGRGGPVIAGGRVFLFSYRGEGADQAEGLTCFDAKTGKMLWEKRLPDFLSDNSYSRYAIGSPTVDPESGNIFLMSTAGELVAVDRDGKTLWQHSLFEEMGRLSFPNGRTGSPVVIGDLVIVRGITANWGGDGPARDRFYAFQKTTGQLVWSSTPGLQPQDGSFSTGIFQMRDGIPVMYATTGCGHFIALNALTGKPLWRFLSAKGGINASCVLVGDKLIAAHDKENTDTTMTGGFECVRLPAGPLPPGPPEDPVPVLGKSAEA